MCEDPRITVRIGQWFMYRCWDNGWVRINLWRWSPGFFLWGRRPSAGAEKTP